MLTKITNELLDKVIAEIKKPENMDKIHISIIDPLIHYTFNKLYPYILVSSIIFFLIFLLVITTLLLLIRMTYL